MSSFTTGKEAKRLSRLQLTVTCIAMMAVSTIMGLGYIYPLRPADVIGWLALIFFCPGIYLASGYVFEKILEPKLTQLGKKISPKPISATRIVILLGLMLSWVTLLVVVYIQVKPYLTSHFLEW